MYTLKNIKCSYSKSIRPVLEIDELEINKNEVVFFVGPSGVGKSTILETLGLMNDTDRNRSNNNSDSKFELAIYGKKEIDMRSIWDKKESYLSNIRNSHFSFIFQENNLFLSLSGMQNAISSSIVKGMTSENSFKKAVLVRDEILSDINLDNNNDFSITSISGGQRQRLSFIRAVITNYNILFADEPTGNLDWLNAEILMGFLLDNMKEDSSVILVSHDIDLALKFADKIVYLEKQKEIINGKDYFYGKIKKETIFHNIDKEKGLWKNSDGNFSRKDLKKIIKTRFKEHN